MFRIVQVLGFIVFCFAIGEVIAVFITGVIFGISTEEVFKALDKPQEAGRNMLLTLGLLSSLFRFLVVPFAYLLFTNKQSLTFLRPANGIRFTRALVVVVLLLSIIPFISILIEVNQHLSLPGWLPGIETYLRQSELNAHQWTSTMLAFDGIGELLITIVVIAIVPGIVEEFFFRGIVQGQLSQVIDAHYAIFINATFFSLLHFQFYGFLPRMALGMLLGYLYLWTKNIWYPVMAHVVNNLIGVLGAWLITSEL